MGMPTLKILLAFAIEFLLSQIIALGIGLCLGLLFYKLLVMILLKVSYVNFAIGFYFNWRALLPVILLIPILQVILFLNNLITIKRLSLLRLLKPKRPNVPEILPLWQLQLLSLLVLGLLLGGAQGFVNLFSVDDFLAQQLNISLVAGLCLAILLLSIAWILGLMGLWRIVIPTVILCLRRFKKLYFIQQRIFTISEISRWSFRNVKSLTGITLLLGLAFTFLGMGALVSRYGLNTIDNYTPYSLLATANKQVEIDQILKRDKVVAQVQPIFQTKILPVNYNLDTVVGHNYRSNADPSMVMTQATYNRFARYRGLKTLKLKPNQAGIIMPVTSILKAASKKDIAAQKPVVQVGTYAQLKLQITSITN
ncbi:hypothetical protein JCM14202_1376 [Agrilactobacillus composti DSM 18527 = JCM 14202]|nr:hypothetical protein JCM14202_1376 [Agrilactobacillus composti DSM 18527 = JCM 14202]